MKRDYGDALQMASELNNTLPFLKVAGMDQDHKWAVAWPLLWAVKDTMSLSCLPRKNLLAEERNFNGKRHK